ncbi:MAG: TraB/GumN family protein [Anaerolineales bacterium]
MNLFSWLTEKPLRMVWRVEKDGNASHLVGTAHFFPYSFRRSLTRLMQGVATVMFEGPLDEASSERIAEYGRQGEDFSTFVDAVTPEAVQAIDRLLRERLDGQDDAWLLSLVERRPVYFEAFTRGVRPWAAFFSIWQTYLGWKYSVDLEGYQIARKLGKQVLFLETLEEQLAVLDNIPPERIARQLNDVENWDIYQTDYVRIFLEGDLEKMVELTARFATRGPVVVGARDRILFERMKPVFECEGALGFVGFPHVPGVSQLLREDGYIVTQVTA